MKAHQNSDRIKQTILYYPTISIPSSRWLRQTLLYWDEIGSIVPQRYDETELLPYTPDIQYLKDEGEFRPFRTDLIFRRDWKTVQDFENELVDTVLSNEFQSLLPQALAMRKTARVHQDKVSHEVFNFLRDAGLAEERDHDGDWYYFEHATALLYMSLLAKYLSGEDSQATVPGTNLHVYERLNFHAKSNSNAFDGLSVKFFNILPVPSDRNSLPDILDFKRRRRDQLLNFRQVLNDTQTALSECDSKSAVNDVLAEFDNKIEKGLTDLGAALKDARIATIAGSFESLVKASSPGWLATLIVASGTVKNVVDVPIQWALGGTLLGGTIGVGKYLIDKRNERRAAIRNSPFSYLYSAQREGLLR